MQWIAIYQTTQRVDFTECVVQIYFMLLMKYWTDHVLQMQSKKMEKEFIQYH